MSREAIIRHYGRLFSLWPRDPLRPLSFHSFLQHRVAVFDPPKQHSGDVSRGSQDENTQTVADVGATPHGAMDPKTELVNVNALYSLVENQYSKRYPLNETYLRPASNPEYYTNLMAELGRAPDSTWWSRFVGRWKGFVQFK